MSQYTIQSHGLRLVLHILGTPEYEHFRDLPIHIHRLQIFPPV